jgi:alpha-glucosidase
MIAEYEAALPPGGWPNWVLGNHDRPRIATRVGAAQARVAAMLLLTLRGTPTLYYGDELGLEDVAIPPDRVRDPRELREPGLGFGRDPVRTPMPWDGSPHAGFTSGTPWLPLNPDWPTRNVAAQADDPASSLALHRALLRLRRTHDALAIGAVRLIEAEGDVLAYERTHGRERIVIALNLGSDGQRLIVPGEYDVLLSTHPESRRGAYAGSIALAPDEGVILRARNPA